MENREKKPDQDAGMRVAFSIAIILIISILILYVIRQVTTGTKTVPTLMSTLDPTLPSTITLTVTLAQPSEIPTSTPIPSEIPTSTLTPSETPTPTPTLSVTSTPDTHSTSTPFPSPVDNRVNNIVGTNLPDGFRIDTWINDYIECDHSLQNRTVSIFGVHISHGHSPYEFTFWQLDNIYHPFIKSVTSLDDFKEFIKFDEPVVVNKGEYVHVVLTFHSVNGIESTLIDDLYFPYTDSSHCR